MKTTELKLVYFSPTGTTRRVIMEAARQIDLKSVSFDLSVHKEKSRFYNLTKQILSCLESRFIPAGFPKHFFLISRHSKDTTLRLR